MGRSASVGSFSETPSASRLCEGGRPDPSSTVTGIHTCLYETASERPPGNIRLNVLEVRLRLSNTSIVQLQVEASFVPIRTPHYPPAALQPGSLLSTFDFGQLLRSAEILYSVQPGNPAM